MAYTKQTWADLPSKTTPINAERLTHIEDGIFNAAQTADTAASTAGTAAANVGIVSGRVETLTGRVNDLDTAVSNKVDKVTGKGLSTNDYDDTDKGKVDSLGTASTKNSTSVVTDSSDLVESGAVYDALGWGNKNDIVYPYYHASGRISNGVTYTIDDNNGVIANGQATGANSTFYLQGEKTWPYNRNMILNGCPSGGGDDSYKLIVWDVTASTGYIDIGEGVEIPDTVYGHTVSIYIWVKNGYTANNVTFYPMISKDGGVYEPYHASVDESKADNSVIAPTENGTTASQAYAVGSHAIRNGAFITWKNAKAQGETINDASDYDSGDVASELALVTSSLALSSGIAAINNQVAKQGNVCSVFLYLDRTSMSSDLIGIAPVPVNAFAFLPVYDTTTPFDIIGVVFIRGKGVGLTEGEVHFRKYNDATLPNLVYIEGSYVCID